MLVVVGCLAIAGAVLVGIKVFGENNPPYTYRQLMFADVDCDAEDLARALPGTTNPRQAVEDTLYEGSGGKLHEDCLKEKLPQLSDEQVENFSDTVEEARKYDREHN